MHIGSPKGREHRALRAVFRAFLSKIQKLIQNKVRCQSLTSISQPHPWGLKLNSKFHSSHAPVSIRRLGKASQSTCTPSIGLQLSEQFKHHSNFQIIASKSAFNLGSIIRIFKLSTHPKPGILNFSCWNFQISNFQILNFLPNLVPLQGLWDVTAQAHQRERLDDPFQ